MLGELRSRCIMVTRIAQLLCRRLPYADAALSSNCRHEALRCALLDRVGLRVCEVCFGSFESSTGVLTR